MNNARRPLQISFILVFSTLWLWLGSKDLLPKPFCPFRKLTGIPCPGCGGTRASIELLQGHLFVALQINPLSVVLVIILMVMLVLSWYDYVFKTNHLNIIVHKRLPQQFFIPMICLIVIVWIRNICHGV